MGPRRMSTEPPRAYVIDLDRRTDQKRKQFFGFSCDDNMTTKGLPSTGQSRACCGQSIIKDTRTNNVGGTSFWGERNKGEKPKREPFNCNHRPLERRARVLLLRRRGAFERIGISSANAIQKAKTTRTETNDKKKETNDPSHRTERNTKKTIDGLID